MRNLMKTCALAAAVLSVTMFQGGCFGLNLQTLLAIANEDIFG
jgi:hypothetical protein